MLRRLILEKLQLIKDPRDTLFREALRNLLLTGPREDWKGSLSRLFTRLLSRIALEENVSPLDEDETEVLFKHHLPDFVTGMIRALEEILYSEPVTNDDLEAFETALHLMLRVLEWTVWNYEGGRCIYGEENAEKADALFRLAPYSVEVWGDRDEVWLILLEAIGLFSHSEDIIDRAQNHYSCRTYSAIIKDLPEEFSVCERFWKKGARPLFPALILGVESRIVDQTTIRILLKDLTKNGAQSSGALEGKILSYMAEQCGVPVREQPMH